MYNGISIPTSGKTKETFDLIILTAEKLFSERGYNITSIRDIAQEAKIAVGTIYRYFENKYTLYSYVLDKYQMLIRATTRQAIKDCKTRYEKEKEGLRAWLYFVRENPSIYRIIWESLYIDEKLFKNYYSSYQKSYSYALKKDQDQLKDDDFDTIGFILISLGTFLGVDVLIQENPSDEVIDKIVETTMKILKEGMFTRI